MKKKKQLTLALCAATLLMGCLTGCSVSSDDAASPIKMDSLSVSDRSVPSLAAAVENNEDTNMVTYTEQFKPYEQFGLTYDADKNELQYHGKLVRWFEDYYTMEDGTQAGRDFFNKEGVVDVYAVRDFSSFVQSDDGSFDPSGKLVGIEEFSEKEFAARDINAITNPTSIAMASGSLSVEDFKDMAKEYEAFGVTYAADDNQWYFNGEKVCFFLDILASNGESLTNGNFSGSIRTFESENGTIGIYTVRDFANPAASGFGTLTSVEKFSQKELKELL